MLKTTKEWLAHFVMDLALFITCDTDEPINEKDAKKYPAWTKSPQFLADWKSNCNIIINAMRQCVRNGHDGQFFMMELAQDVLPTDKDLEYFDNEDTCYQKWRGKMRRTLQSARTGCALNWEWKAGRKDLYKKCPCGDDTSLWAPHYYFCCLLFRELRVIDRNMLESMNPSHNPKHAKHDYGEIMGRELHNGADQLLKEFPALKGKLGQDSREEKDFWEWADEKFEEHREKYSKTKPEDLTAKRKATLKFWGKGGWKSCFTLDESCLDNCRRPGTILRWRREVRNLPTDDLKRWSTPQMETNIKKFSMELKDIKIHGEKRFRSDEQKKVARKTENNKYYMSSDDDE